MSNQMLTVSRPVFIGNDGKQSITISIHNDRAIDKSLREFNLKVFNNGVPFYIKIGKSDFLVESIHLSGNALWISLRYYVDGDSYGDKENSEQEKELRSGQFFLTCDDLMGMMFTSLVFLGDRGGYKKTLFKI